jgi:hypothetical protein
VIATFAEKNYFLKVFLNADANHFIFLRRVVHGFEIVLGFEPRELTWIKMFIKGFMAKII